MLCKYIKSREWFGLSASRFPTCDHSPVARTDLSFMLADFKNYTTDESSTVDNDGMCVPPLACSFAKMQQYQQIVGVVDEDGFLVLYNTMKTGGSAIVRTWQVHTNAVFDLEWLQHEDKILTGSGDQTIALHDVSTCSKLDTFKGHASSVKSISSHTSNDAVFVSGSRDGHIMMWDKRVSRRDGTVPPVNTIYNAHMLQPQHVTHGKQRKKRSSSGLKDAQQSVTSVLFQNENSVISAGAVDGCLKVWDIRKTYKVKLSGAAPVHVLSYSGSNSRRHGYTSLVLDSQRLRLFASCTDDVIYEYNMASYNPNPVQSWRGHKNSTFYVKTALSPDDQFLLSGSSDEKAYIWQINKPNSSPVVLESHSAEVTSVAWCPNDITKLVTLSDDTKIKLWRIFCRELDRNLLPHNYGQARKLSKERATSTEMKDDRIIKRDSNLSTTPNKPLLQKSSSAPPAAQSCMRTWLKTNKCSPIQKPQRQSRLGKGSDSSEATVGLCSQTSSEASKDCDIPKFDSPKPCGTCTISTKVKQSSTSSEGHSTLVCPVCGHEKSTSLDSPHLGSSSDTVSSSCDHSENTSSESDLSSPLCVPRSLSKNIASGSEIPSVKHCAHPSNPEVENVSPKKMKRFLNSDSPVSSPKRPCLTNIESNNQTKDACLVKKSLFPKDDKIDAVLDSTINADRMSCTTPKSPCLNKDGMETPPRKHHTTCSEGLLSKLTQDTNEDLNSPTLNLPNLVLDQANSINASPKQVNNVASPKPDWLTCLRMERQRKSADSKQTVTISPKVTRGMKKIQSYFKPKDL